MSWDNADDMVTVYRERFRTGLPLWSVYSYRSAEQYERKLEWFSQALRRLPRDWMLLDIGCGVGELLHWCEQPRAYRGVDLVPEFIEHARHRYAGYRFEVCDVLT